jgi:site-specific recombinase XerD
MLRNAAGFVDQHIDRTACCDAAIPPLCRCEVQRHFGRSPDRLGLEEVRAYQLRLIAQRQSWSHINQSCVALRFFYSVNLGRTHALDRIVAARDPQKLPAVLSADEIARFLEAAPGLRNPAALMTAYGAGLRIGEIARLTTGAIDNCRMLIRVEARSSSITAPVGQVGQDADRSAYARLTVRENLHFFWSTPWIVKSSVGKPRIDLGSYWD